MKENKVLEFLKSEEENLIEVLRRERYDMIMLAWQYLYNRKQMKGVDIGRLDALVGSYRRSSLRHAVSRGIGALEESIIREDSRTESLV